MNTQPVISAALILPQLQAPDWQTAIRMLGERLQAAGYVHETYVPAVLDREAIFPTGLPLGTIDVAIPHTDVAHVVTPGIAVATLASPVTWQQMGSPEESVSARIVFLLAMKDPQAQVNLLANLVDIFQKEEVLRQLTETTDVATIERMMIDELRVQEAV